MMGVRNQQTYCEFENNKRNHKLTTLEAFCVATKIELMYLLSDIPVTDETLAKYGSIKYSEIITISRHGNYEFKTHVTDSFMSGTTPELNYLTKEMTAGWELISAVSRGLENDKLIYYFKRKI